MADPTPDLNQTIVHAIQARIEADVAAAMLQEETWLTFVQSALQQPLSLDNGRTKTTFLRHTLNGAIETATKQAVADELEAIKPEIAKEVRKALRSSIGVIADSLVDGFVANAQGRYPSIKVEFQSRD